jgi:hypothetical protein
MTLTFPSPDLDRCTYYVSVDIGIQHLALLLLEVDKSTRDHGVVWFALVDLTTFSHATRAAQRNCPLPHTRTFADWLTHLFHEYAALFDLCETVLIERQPPVGHVVVEQLLFYRFREKAVLIHPRTVHGFFGWSHCTYDQRKAHAERVLQRHLSHSSRSWLLPEWDALSRKHDVADAYAQVVVYVTHVMHVAHVTRRVTTPSVPGLDALERFRFNPWDDHPDHPPYASTSACCSGVRDTVESDAGC